MSELPQSKPADELIPTRHSLLTRLKDWNDHESWKLFFETYWRLIYRAAIRAGLSDAEAQDVVQETVISVCKGIPNFECDPRKGSFKNWLLHLTGWRIKDQLRKRQRQIEHPCPDDPASARTSTIDRAADPAGDGMEAVWEKEWETNLLEAAIERVKRKVDSKQFQIFDLYVLQQWPAERVARALKVSAARVYLAKHRIGRLLKTEVASLRNKPL